MGLVITNSPDISLLEYQITWDISGLLPAIELVNMSQGNNLGNLSTWFVATSPSGTFIHEGSQGSPDIVGSWTNQTLNDQWPMPWNSIEWSGPPYTMTVNIVDSQGNLYQLTKTASICRPNGNSPQSKNPYGLAQVNLEVLCDQARIYFQDITNSTYKGITGTQVSSVLTVVYPLDQTGNIPAPFIIGQFAVAMVPITYSSANYQFFLNEVWSYNFGNYVFVNINYQSKDYKNGGYAVTFPVYCNIDLGQLTCQIQQLIQNLEQGNCADVVKANRDLMLINSKMNLVVIGTLQPLSGIDVPRLVNEIIEIGGFPCDCCNAPTGIIPNTASVIDGYTFSVNSQGGDIRGSFTATGNNIVLNLNDLSYVFALCPGIPTTAFTITPSTSGYTKTYCLNISMSQFATDLANTILGNVNLVNLWQSIFQGQPGAFDLIVDGGCIFQSTSTCNYTFTLSNIPASTTFALLSGIKIGDTVNSLSFAFNLTNLPALQAYLNALGFGTFTVGLPSPNIAGEIIITSNANPNDIQAITYKVSGTTYVASQVKNCTGYVQISANQVVQNIINYICNISDEQIETSQDYTICYLNAQGEAEEVDIPAGSSVSALLAALVTNNCTTVNFLSSTGVLSCASIQALFPTSVNLMGATDFILGTKAGGCARIGAVELGMAILNLGSFNQSFVDAFCSLIVQCAGGQGCAPYNTFNAILTPYNNSCPSIVNFTYGWNNDVLNITNITYGNTPATNQTISVYYRQSGTPTYTLYNSAITVGADGTVLTPIAISLSPGISYDIQVVDNCSSPAAPFVMTVTAPGNTYTVKMTSDAYGVTVTAVGGLTGFTLAAPLTAGGFAYGTHNALTGAVVTLSVTFGSPVPPQVSAIMKVNGTQIDCANLTGTGTFPFGAHNFNLTDFVEIDLQQASC